MTYDAETGECLWKNRPLSHFKNTHGCNFFNAKHGGTVVGSKITRRNGVKKYIQFQLSVMDGDKYITRKYTLHLVIFALMGKPVPKGMQVDHINMDRWDNRWSNLRVATQTNNMHNATGQSTKKSGLPKGVFKASRGKRYIAQTTVGGVLHVLGRFNTPEEAKEAYERGAVELHGEFARVNGKSVVAPAMEATTKATG